MDVFGLIGYPLSHSFSKKYFADKFEKEGIQNCEYNNYELSSMELFPSLIEQLGDELCGLNVTIPYKKDVIKYLDKIDESAEKIGAVNVIKNDRGKLIGYNSDYYGFLSSLEGFVGDELSSLRALVLGTGGAAQAVVAALDSLTVPYKYVSRSATHDKLAYADLTDDIIKQHRLIINTTPLGMHPNVDVCPPVPYTAISEGHYLFDLIYNPEETLFMKKGRRQGAKALHGLEMLIGQAEKAWEIWNN